MDHKQASFNFAISHIFMFEGGYVNDPLDKGGETKYGISKRQYPHLDIKNLTKEDAGKIYYRDYFEKIYNKNRSIWFNAYMFEGSILHPAVIRNFIKDRPIADPYSLEEYRQIMDLCKVRLRHYRNIVERNFSQIRFLYGWCSRALWIFIEIEKQRHDNYL